LDDKLIKESLAELIGTFTLVFVGGMAVVVAPLFGVVVPALAHGLILVGIIFVFGHISGAFVNPAVTLAVLITGKMEAPKAAAFMVMQFLGGTIAALFITTLIPNEVRSSMLNGHFNYGATTGSLTDDFVWRAAIFEAVMTFFLAGRPLIPVDISASNKHLIVTPMARHDVTRSTVTRNTVTRDSR
jgi:glycerol uptake facilitator-like aquaporin